MVDVDPGGRLVERYHEAVLTRLGEGLRDRGPLLPAAVDRTLSVVEHYARHVRAEGAESVAIATSAVRRAEDGAAFRERFRELTGVELRILSGEEEARYSFVGATYGASPADRVAVLDIGGGSTECAVGTHAVEATVSIEIGAVRLTEMFPALAGRDGADAARVSATDAAAYVTSRLAAAYANLRADRMMAVAGTPRTIGGIAFAGEAGQIDGRVLADDDIATVLERLLATSYDERKTIRGMTPERADILAAGAIILRIAMSLIRVRAVTITRNDLLLGFLAD